MSNLPTRRKRRTVAEFGPDPVDIHVGGRVRLRRTLLGMSQSDLGRALGLTFQQVQKNERGYNRIGASRLYQLTCILDVPIGFFFEGLDTEQESRPADDVMLKRETMELVRAYYRISNPKVRDALKGMARAMAEDAQARQLGDEFKDAFGSALHVEF